MIFAIFYFILLLTPVFNKIYDGPCPHFNPIKDFVCSEKLGKGLKFRVLAHLPTSNQTLNLFHNPMGDIEDLEFQLKCAGVDNEHIDENEYKDTVEFHMFCNDTEVKGTIFSIHTWILYTKFGFLCFNLDEHFAFGCNHKSLSIPTSKFEVIKYPDCKLPPIWAHVAILNYVEKEYVLLWGCRELGNNKNEQGAYVLGFSDNLTRGEKSLNDAFNKDLKFTKVAKKDFILQNKKYDGPKSECSFNMCSYFHFCKE